MYWHMGALSKCLSNKCLSEQDLSIGVEKDLPTPDSILHSLCNLFQESFMAVYYVPGEVLHTESTRK